MVNGNVVFVFVFGPGAECTLEIGPALDGLNGSVLSCCTATAISGVIEFLGVICEFGLVAFVGVIMLLWSVVICLWFADAVAADWFGSVLMHFRLGVKGLSSWMYLIGDSGDDVAFNNGGVGNLILMIFLCCCFAGRDVLTRAWDLD